MQARIVAVLVVIAASTVSAQEAATDNRPQGFTVGLGAGWATPIRVLEPNAVSARFRVGPVTFEPSLEVRGLSGSDDNSGTTTFPGQPPSETNSVDRNSGFNAGINTDVRYPVISRGPVDFLVIGGVGFATQSSTQDRNVENAAGDIDRSRVNGTALSVGWGLGAEWFFHRNFSFSADVRNPLFRLAKTSTTTETKQAVGTESLTTSNRVESTDLDYGVVFSPTVRAMFHFYF